MHLIAAPMLFGLALAAVPIILHLLNRRRFRIVEWAPMKYLRLTLKTNRRRMRIEQLLLLIVRTAVVAMLFVALARPALSRSELGGWLASRARTSRIIVIDDSLSMGYQVDRISAFDGAKDAASQVLRGIGAQDAVTVVLTSRPDAPLVREASLQDPTKLLAQIAELRPVDAACDWAAMLARVEELFASAAHQQKELILLTDLRRSGWDAKVSEAAARLKARSIDLKVIDTGTRRTENTVLARFEQEDPLALPGAPVKLRATIRNDSPETVRGARATLEIDDRARPLVLPDLPAGQTIELPLTVTLDSPGPHVLRLVLPGDALPADDARWLSVSVRQRFEIALIDGQLASGPFESSTDFLHVAFTAGSDPWQVTRRSDAQWQHLDSADVIVLSNIASLSAQHVAELEKLVSNGAGLMIFVGDQVDPQLYDQRLYRDGAGLLPARLDHVIDEPPGGLIVEGLDDSSLAPLVKIATGALSRIRPRRLFVVSTERSRTDQQVRVLARWNDADAHPAVIEKRFGRGRVLLWTITADRQWSDWPVDPTYVLAMRSAAMTIARPDPVGNNFTAGYPIAYQPDDDAPAREPRITIPDASEPTPLVSEPDAIRFAQTHLAGRYLLNWKDPRGLDVSRVLCASFDPVESNLEPLTQDELLRLLAPLQPIIVHWTPGGDSLTEAGREIWRTIMMTVLALAAVETALAVWVGRER